MKWATKDSIFNDDCETEALRVFEQNHLFTKDEIITSLEYTLEHLRTEEGFTQSSREKMVELYERFLIAVKKCKLPNLSPEDWRFYEYGYVGDGITLELCKAEEIEFHDAELKSILTTEIQELFRVDSEYVSIQEFASIQGVKEDTVIRWINAGKLKSARLDGGVWLIPAVQKKPHTRYFSSSYSVKPGLRIDEYPFVQYSDTVWIDRDKKDKAVYRCVFRNPSKSFQEVIELTKDEAERLEYLLISSGKAKIDGFMQWMPNIKP